MNAETPDRISSTLLLLAEPDDVVIAVRDLAPGVHLVSNGDELELARPVGLGHKVARRRLRAGQQVMRYGVPIGTTTVDVEQGAWVHTHNLASDYIATYAHRGATA